MRLRLFLLLCISGCATATSQPISAGPTDAAQVKPAAPEEITAAIRAPGATAVLVNVWATWCEPCREEMPEIVRFYQENKAKGLRLVLISADVGEDGAKEAAAFLKAQGIDIPSFLKSGDDMVFINTLDKTWAGNLPTSWMYDGQGQVVERWTGTVTAAGLQTRFNTLGAKQ